MKSGNYNWSVLYEKLCVANYEYSIPRDQQQTTSDKWKMTKDVWLITIQSCGHINRWVASDE